MTITMMETMTKKLLLLLLLVEPPPCRRWRRSDVPDPARSSKRPAILEMPRQSQRRGKRFGPIRTRLSTSLRLATEMETPTAQMQGCLAR